jgi:magnesium chelatase family protein
LPKDSGRLDLPIALGILAASGQIDATHLSEYEFAGELSFSGELRPVRGSLATALALHTGRVQAKLVLPPASAEEAALVQDSHVYRARHMLDVVRHFAPPSGIPSPEGGEALPVDSEGWIRIMASPLASPRQLPDMADVKGQTGPKRALEIAAAGGHSLLLMRSIVF